MALRGREESVQYAMVWYLKEDFTATGGDEIFPYSQHQPPQPVQF